MKDIDDQKKVPAVFLDRDGTVCREMGYLSRVEDLQLLPGAAEAIRKLNRSGRKVVIVSNQSGVARGYFTEAVVHHINAALIELLKAEGARVDGIYFCPHHPEGQPPYNIECSCRKPATGQIRKAARDLHLDISRSVIIGDKFSDVQTGQNLGIPGILVLTGYGKEEYRKYQNKWRQAPDYIARDIGEAVDWWLARQARAND